MQPRPGSPGSPLWDPDAVPAATVIVVRDSDAGVEVLMLKRDRGLSFAGGNWVFPGGRIDPDDRVPDDEVADDGVAGDGVGDDGVADDGVEAAARRAAVREAREEAGLVIGVESLRRWSHWTPPPESPKRFSTAFFVAPVNDITDVVTVDDGEIRDHRWARPLDVIALRDAGEIELSPPTYVTLVQLGDHRSVNDLMAGAEHRDIEHFATRLGSMDDTFVALYHGDVAYEGGDVAAAGPRHRLWLEDRWRYERDAAPD